MHRRAAVNTALALLVGGLAVFVALAPPREASAPQPTLGQIPVDAVSMIRITRHGAAPLMFRRTGAEWSLVDPLYAPANPLRIRDLLAAPGMPVLHTVDPVAGGLARFQLDPPLVTLHIDDNEYAFGTTDGLDGRRYVRHGDHVYLVPDTMFVRLTQGAGFFIDPALIRPGIRPSRIALPGRVLVRDGGRWHVDPGSAGDPPADAVAAAWESARAIMVRVGAGDAVGARITVDFESGVAAEFEFLRLDGHPVLLRRDLDLQYLLDPEQARQLMLTDAVPAEGEG